MSSGFTYWCHECNQPIRPRGDALECPACHGGFMEEFSGFTTDTGLHMSPTALFLSHYHFLRHDRTSDDGYRRRPRRRLFEGRRNSLQNRFQVFLEAALSPRPYFWEIDSHTGGEVLVEFLDGGDRFSALPSSFQDPLHALFTGEDGDGGRQPRRLVEVRDIFMGSELEQLIHHLAERDSGTYGTAPASKAAVDALPVLKITKQLLDSDDVHCAVCKELFDIGMHVKQMPCKHIYHRDCILPWLELHSTCPVCRFQMPTEESSSSGLPQRIASTISDETSSQHSRLRRDPNGDRGLAIFGTADGGIRVHSFDLWPMGTNNQTDGLNETLVLNPGSENGFRVSSHGESSLRTSASPGSNSGQRSGSTSGLFSRFPRHGRSFGFWPFRSSNSPSFLSTSGQPRQTRSQEIRTVDNSRRSGGRGGGSWLFRSS
eukprot:c19644_g1_i1 orf=469-1758(+)